MEKYCMFCVAAALAVGALCLGACGASNQQPANDQTTVTVEKPSAPSGSAAAGTSAPAPSSGAAK
jgi:hypothetical protein